MNVAFKESFYRDIKKIKELTLRQRIKTLIEQVEAAEKLSDIDDLKKLKAADCHYRIQIGDYRCGVIYQASVLTFVRFLHRKDLYRYFPTS